VVGLDHGRLRANQLIAATAGTAAAGEGATAEGIEAAGPHVDESTTTACTWQTMTQVDNSCWAAKLVVS
jgi:hypothetical protein